MTGIYDDHVNFAASTITVAPSPATSGTTFTMGGTNWPTPPFNITVWPSGQKPSSTNAEIIRVTARTGGAVTASVRAQEGTTAKPVTTSYAVTAGVTVKAIRDLENKVNWISPDDFGILGNGTDETSKWTTMIAYLNSTSNTSHLFLPIGEYGALGGFSLTKSGIMIQGESREYTTLYNLSTTNDFFQMNGDSQTMRDLGFFQATPTPTAGAAIHIQSGDASMIDNVNINGFWIGIDSSNSYHWTVTGSMIEGHKKYGIRVRSITFPDGGDQGITNCTIQSTLADAQIRWESGGGTKITSCKLVDGGVGFDAALTDGASTADLQIVNTSLENFTVAALRYLRLGSTGGVSSNTITGNQILAATAGVAGIIMGDGFFDTTITGNVIKGNSTAVGLEYQGGAGGGTVTGNEFLSWATGIKNTSTTYGLHVSGNRFGGVANWFEDNSVPGTVNPVVFEYRSKQRVSGLTSTATYTNLWQIDMSTFRSTEVDLFFGLLLNGVSRASRKINVIIGRESGNCIVTTVSDTVSGAVIDVQFDVTTTAGSVIIGVKRNAAAGGTDLVGPIDIKATGHINKFKPL